MGAWGAVLGLSGALTRRADLSASGERGMHAASFFVLLAMCGLGWALAIGNLTYRYVASWSSYATPLPYRLGAVWAGSSGALLLWALVLGVAASVAAATLRRDSALRAWTAALLALLLLAVLALAGFDTNPFVRLPFPPDDGHGIPLEWMRPLVLLQMPLGYAAAALTAIPSVMTVMGALGTAPWRRDARRWALVSFAAATAAALLDWRRRYGEGQWLDDWRWAPLFEGTALVWIAALLLVLASSRVWRANASVLAGFVAFTLGLAGLTLRRASGWQGVFEFAASDAGRVVGWVALGGLVLIVAGELRRLARATTSVQALSERGVHVAITVAAIALAATSWEKTERVGLAEGSRGAATDRYGTAWSLSLEGVSRVGREDVVSDVVAIRAAVKGKARAFVTAQVRSRFVGDRSEPVDQVTLLGLASGLAQDLRVDVEQTGTSEAVVGVRFVPLATWIWIAGLAAVIQALVAAFASAGAPSAVGVSLPDAREPNAPAPDASASDEPRSDEERV